MATRERDCFFTDVVATWRAPLADPSSLAPWSVELGNFEFVASFADAAHLVGLVNGERVYLIVRIDDILVAARGAERIAKIKAHLADNFDVRDLEVATYFLGMEPWGHWRAALRADGGTLGGGVWGRALLGEDRGGRNTFGWSDEVLEAFCDTDFAGNVDMRRSTTGHVFLVYGGEVSWSSRLQPTVAAQTVEGDMSAEQAVKEALWFRMAGDLGLDPGTVQIHCDNNTALEASDRPQRSKHIDVLHHFARKRVARKEVGFARTARWAT
ncbi:hypothetical protein KFL_012550040 [Klebsormidium nitens]|uniref:Reverse transcriptase Ty1/copia-type domain-containing protein n=1 Tax=Klebsormidium nitens TaxID=105231 RepID=A0A1Y1ISK0_KLENI|nr:hypothetical protein KFL_012550040 [Klebsormidium nitens]|eukprot:GAQ93022.1 hypothetical protein KFL_012550040 [Klebsormidium nitens]